MSRYLVSALALICALTAPAVSFASDGDASVSIKLTGYVPVICRAQLQGSQTPLGDGSVSLGNIDEFCNAPGAYRVVVDYSGSGDLGSLIIDGQEVELDGSGRAVLVEHNGPGQNVHALSYAPGADQITTLRISVEADMI